MKVRNRTPHPLHSMLPHPIHLSYHWFGHDGRVLVESGLRTVIHPELLPGESQSFPLRVRAPESTGRCLLRIALVQELVRWFDEPVRWMKRDFRVRVVPAPKP